MLDSNTILGVYKFLGCDKYQHGIMRKRRNLLPCGGPIVYPADIDINSDLRTPILSLFPQRIGNIISERIAAKAVDIKEINLKPLYKNHKVISIDRFDIGKFNRVLEFVRDVGAITFIIEYSEGKEKITKAISEIQKLFNFSGLFSLTYTNNSNNLLGEDDRYVCVVTMLDIPYCLPIFNTHKVDGIGLSFTGTTINWANQIGALKPIFRADFIYSNYEDNIFVVDGVTINKNSMIDRSIYDRLHLLAQKKFGFCRMSSDFKIKNFSDYKKINTAQNIDDYVNYNAFISSNDGIIFEDSNPEMPSVEEYIPEDEDPIVENKQTITYTTSNTTTGSSFPSFTITNT